MSKSLVGEQKTGRTSWERSAVVEPHGPSRFWWRRVKSMPIQDLQLPDLTPLTVQGRHATYAIEPLSPGYGATVSTMLRRVLLSHLPGVAISSLRVLGDSEETQELPGVEESLVELMLNVK